MAYKIRTGSRKQELKKPDEFVSLLDRIQHWGMENTRFLSIFFLVLVVAGAAAGGIYLYQDRQAQKASGLEFKALQFFQQQGQAVEEADTLTPEENYKKAVDLFQQIIRDFPRTPSATMARYYLANAYLNLKDFEAAVKAYQDFLKIEKRDIILRGLVLQRLGYAYLSKNEPEKAIEAFKTAIAMEGIMNKDQVYYELGHLYHMLGKNDEAIPNYQAVAEQFPDSLFLSASQTHLRELGVTEVKPPADEEATEVMTPGPEGAEEPASIIPAETEEAPAPAASE
ncbi:MAG TPA: tetratricopeptide repeat protein [Nitrospiria bacterium]|nr:tetratricopeptide repeat protein [Nitrospiria bacterium]